MAGPPGWVRWEIQAMDTHASNESVETWPHQAPKTAIPVELLKLALIARKANPAVRWAAMANSIWSARTCRGWKGAHDEVRHQPPTLSPMLRGGLHAAIKRQRLAEGLASIRRTYGAGLRSLLAEPAHVLPGAAA